jgi:hypothetical protein
MSGITDITDTTDAAAILDVKKFAAAAFIKVVREPSWVRCSSLRARKFLYQSL